MKNHSQLVRNFLSHKLTIEGKSPLTVKEYAYDLQTFFRYIVKRLEHRKEPLEEIDITGVTIELIRRIEITDIYEYLMFLSKEKQNGVKSRARKLSAIKSFYKYLCVKVHLLEHDIAKDLEMPKTPKTLPRYLELGEAKLLLDSVGGKQKERDYLMLMILLNCGLRVSELQNIKLSDIRNDTLTVTGKGNKERQLFLNEATQKALQDYLQVRKHNSCEYLLLSSRGDAISVAGIQYTVKNLLRKAGLDATKLSTHKLRHTAATLMYKHGKVDIKTLQRVLGHENLNTTEIYTHTDDSMVKEAIDQNPLAHFEQTKKDSK
ncbi:MAG: tyrosine-type recombinase/integrase [Clostridia bacterium]|nr:tyrosine-type recombinase/integrase [Clostridia bacterium]